MTETVVDRREEILNDMPFSLPLVQNNEVRRKELPAATGHCSHGISSILCCIPSHSSWIYQYSIIVVGGLKNKMHIGKFFLVSPLQHPVELCG